MITVYCPKCLAENRQGQGTCQSCGAKLDEDIGDFVETLISFSLRHPVPVTAAMAAEILGKIGDPRGVQPLIQVLQSSTDPGVLESAATALGRLGSKDAVSSLASALRKGTLVVRLNAAESLGLIGGNEAAEVLVEASVADPSESIRQAASAALEHLKQRSATSLDCCSSSEEEDVDHG